MSWASRRTSELIFFGLCTIAAIVAFFNLAERRPREGHVHMRDGKFILDGEPYFPMVMNYIATFQTDGIDLWPAAYPGYTIGYRYPYRDKDSCMMQIDADMKLIRQMGFNTLRIVKLAEGPKKNDGTGILSLKAFTTGAKDTLITLDSDHLFERYVAGIKEICMRAEQNGLKIILLTSLHPNDLPLETHWRKLVHELREEFAIMAFDLFNEPLYFDSLERSKMEVHEIVKGWRKMVREEIPDHLFTIGLQGIRETFEWDPNILDVDFISFHPYEYEPDQVRNELRWYHENVDVPWIIGETSLPADNDSVPYELQTEFARKVLQQTVNCGGCGFSWWQYKDVEWGEFHSDHMGLVALEGETESEGMPLKVSGTVKPAAQVFRDRDARQPGGDCVRLSNYENYSGHRTSMITGVLKDQDGRPIEGGVVIAWNEYWTSSYHAVSRADGSFELRGDFYFHHWMATATRYDRVRGDCHPNAFFTPGMDAIPSYYLGELKLNELSLPDR